MSVTGTVVTPRDFPLPNGDVIRLLQGYATGDASGGTVSWSFEFPQDNENRVASIQQIAMRCNDQANKDKNFRVYIDARNWGYWNTLIPSSSNIMTLAMFSLVTDVGVTEIGINSSYLINKPIFLGRPTTRGPYKSYLLCDGLANTNTKSYSIFFRILLEKDPIGYINQPALPNIAMEQAPPVNAMGYKKRTFVNRIKSGDWYLEY